MLISWFAKTNLTFVDGKSQLWCTPIMSPRDDTFSTIHKNVLEINVIIRIQTWVFVISVSQAVFLSVTYCSLACMCCTNESKHTQIRIRIELQKYAVKWVVIYSRIDINIKYQHKFFRENKSSDFWYLFWGFAFALKLIDFNNTKSISHFPYDYEMK